MGDAFCNQIEVVCCDLWRPYIDVAESVFPQASIVVDRFHVVKLLNNVLDKKRKFLRKENKNEESFKNIKWKLFKNVEKCNKEEILSLNEAIKKDNDLEALYLLRNDFNSIYQSSNNSRSFSDEIDKWIVKAEKVKDKYLDKFISTLRKWKSQIANFANTRITNAATEGLNNFIRYMKRISFGIPNFQNMRLRVLATFI